jgi:hypothetical protein
MFGLSSTELTVALLIAIALMVGLWGPYLYREIVRGKARVGPRAPAGAGDTHPGTRENPAPGQPDGQADPYDDRARR